MLINVLRDEQPTHLAVAFDVSRQTFRSEQFADYKANRSKSPEEFTGQVALIKEVLQALRVPFVEKPGFEADDIIGTLATQAMTGRLRRADLQRRPRLLPARQRPHHRHLPDARRLGDEADDAGRGRGAVRRTARPLPRARGAGRGDLRQPARRPGRRPKTAPPSGSSPTTASTTSSTGPRRSPARRARALREHLGHVMQQPPAQRAGRRPRPAAAARRPRGAAVGPAGGAHALRRPRVPGAPRPALRDARRPRRTSTTPASPST